MSYILDALNRAERERRGVSLADPANTRSRSGTVMLVIAALLAVNAGLLGWWILSGETVAEPADEPTEARNELFRLPSLSLFGLVEMLLKQQRLLDRKVVLTNPPSQARLRSLRRAGNKVHPATVLSDRPYTGTGDTLHCR